jgi:hypothetical protein
MLQFLSHSWLYLIWLAAIALIGLSNRSLRRDLSASRLLVHEQNETLDLQGDIITDLQTKQVDCHTEIVANGQVLKATSGFIDVGGATGVFRVKMPTLYTGGNDVDITVYYRCLWPEPPADIEEEL